jgi:hypothetical protein
MKKLILIAGAAALATTAPLAAKPDHAKGDHGQGKHGNMKHGGAKHAKGSSKSNRGIVTSDRFGNLYALDARGSCPPGLAKKNNGCMAPGQAKKLFNVGQRYDRNAGSMWNYNQIPDALRSQYGLDQSDRYYYNNGYLYQVDQRSSLIERVISTILR